MKTAAENKVIWFEGMFLQPQHFQQQERYLEFLVQQKQAVLEQNAWGFSHLELDCELLSVGKIGVRSAAGIFQDGTLFDIPRNGKAPTPYDIPEGISNTTLYLAIPLRQNSAEAGDKDSEQLFRYESNQLEIKDNIAHSQQITEVQVGSLAVRIVSDDDDLSHYTCLAIARIAESRSNYNISLDNSFLTTCLDVQAFPSLSHLIAEFHGLLNHRAEMLAGRLTDTQQAGTAEIIDFMLLQLVNRYEPIFHYLANKRPLHPEKLFTVLIQLMGEMATFTNDKRRPIEAPAYGHDDPYHTFQPVVKELRHALSMVLEQNATAIPLQAQSHGLWVGQFPEKELLNSNFILAVYGDLPVENIRTIFPSQVKIAPVEQIRTLVSRALPGIEVQPIAVAPRQIPYHANFSYFTLNTKHELWQHLRRSAGIAFHVGHHIPGLKLELWAIKG